MKGLQTAKEVDSADGWNGNIIQLDGCTFHSYEWSVVSSKQNNASPLYFRWFNQDGILKFAGIGLLSGKSIAGIASNKTLSLGSLPCGHDNALRKKVIEDIIEYCTLNSISVIKINSFGTPVGSEILAELGFSVSTRWEFIVNLDLDEENLWRNLNAKKRNKIRKGQKANLTVKTVNDMDDVLQLRKLALETQKRKRDKGISFPVGDEQQYGHLKYNVIDAGIGRMYLAYAGQEPVGGAFFVGFNKKAYYVLSSANQAGLKNAAPDLLLWRSMTDYKKDGYKVFNLGGLSKDELGGQPLGKSGLYQFKTGFSPDVHLCYKGQLVLRPKAFNTFTLLQRIKSKMGL